MTNEYRKTLCDIDLILEQLSEEERNKVPAKLRKLIHDNKLENYTSNIRVDIPLEDQKLSDNTNAFLAMLYINYWTEDENEKLELQKIFNENEDKYQKELSEKYNVDNLFKNRSTNKVEQSEQPVQEQNQIVEYKESIIKRILNKIFSFFKRR